MRISLFRFKEIGIVCRMIFYDVMESFITADIPQVIEIKTDHKMKELYEPPQVEMIEIKVEDSFLGSTTSDTPVIEPGEDF